VKVLVHQLSSIIHTGFHNEPTFLFLPYVYNNYYYKRDASVLKMFRS
jgi:hypothetical protein